MQNSKSILLVEDDIVDVMRVRRALKQLDINNPLVEANNAKEALGYLESNDKPCLILLDISLPGKSGIEFLKEVKENGDFRTIPILMLTGSGKLKDKSDCLRNYAAGYMVKPVDYQKFVEEFVCNMKNIDKYWSKL